MVRNSYAPAPGVAGSPLSVSILHSSVLDKSGAWTRQATPPIPEDPKVNCFYTCRDRRVEHAARRTGKGSWRVAGAPKRDVLLPLGAAPAAPAVATLRMCAREHREVARLWAGHYTALALDDGPAGGPVPGWMADPVVRARVCAFLPTGTLNRSVRRVCRALRVEALRIIAARRSRSAALPGEGKRIKYKDGYAMVRYYDRSVYEGRFTPEEGRQGRGVMWYHSDWHVDCGWASECAERWPPALAYIEGEWASDGLLWGTVALCNGDRFRVTRVEDSPDSRTQRVAVVCLMSHVNSANPLPRLAGSSCSSVEGLVVQRAARPRPRQKTVRSATTELADSARMFDLRHWRGCSGCPPSECTLSIFVDGWSVPVGEVARVRHDLPLSELRKMMYQQSLLSLPSKWAFRIYDTRGRRRYREDALLVVQALPPNRGAFLTQRLRCPWVHTVFGWPAGVRMHNGYALCVTILPCGETPRGELVTPLLSAIGDLAQKAADGHAAQILQSLKQAEQQRQELRRAGGQDAERAARAVLEEERADQDGDPLLPGLAPAHPRRRTFPWREYDRGASGCGAVCLRVSDPSPLGVTALHVACDAGQRDAVELLLRQGADPGAMDWQGRLPLHHAAARGCAHCVSLLLESDDGLAHIDVRSATGCTALHEALQNGFINTALWLVEQGARTDLVDVQGLTPRQLAAAALPTAADYAAAGNERRLLSLLSAVQWGREPWPDPPPPRPVCSTGDYTQGQGDPQPAAAPPSGDEVYGDWLRLRLSQGSQLSDLHSEVCVGRAGARARNVLRLTALHAAAAAGHAAVCDVLARCPLVDVNAADASGCTPLHAAAAAGHTAAVRVLLRRHADVCRRDARGRTPLHAALLRRRVATADLLSLASPPHALRLMDADGAAPVHLCIAAGERCCRLMLSRLLRPLLEGVHCGWWAPPETPLRAAAEQRLQRLEQGEHEHRVKQHCARMRKGQQQDPLAAPHRPIHAVVASADGPDSPPHPMLRQLMLQAELAREQGAPPLHLVEVAVKAGNDWALQYLVRSGVPLEAEGGRSLIEIARHCRRRGSVLRMLTEERKGEQRRLSLSQPSSLQVELLPPIPGEGAPRSVTIGVGLYAAVTSMDPDIAQILVGHPAFDLGAQVRDAATGEPVNPLEAMAALHSEQWPFQWKGLQRRIAQELQLEQQRAEGDGVGVATARRRSAAGGGLPSPAASDQRRSVHAVSPQASQSVQSQRIQGWSALGSASPGPSAASPMPSHRATFEPEPLPRPAFAAALLQQVQSQPARPPATARPGSPPLSGARGRRARPPSDWPSAPERWQTEAEAAFLSALELIVGTAFLTEALRETVQQWARHALPLALSCRRLFALYATACSGIARAVPSAEVLELVPDDWTVAHPANNPAVSAALATGEAPSLGAPPSPGRRRSAANVRAVPPASCQMHALSMRLQYLEPQLLRLLQLCDVSDLDELVHGLCRKRLFAAAAAAVEGASRARVLPRPYREWEQILKLHAEEGEDVDKMSPEELESVVDQLRKQWLSALHFAALHGAAPGACDCATALLRGGGFHPAQASGEGLQALHYAAIGGSVGMVALLLDRRADPDAVATLYEDSQAGGHGPFAPHHRYDYAHGMSEERGARADPYVKAKGTTPLHLAAKRGHHAIVRVLLAHGVRVDRKDKGDNTALMWAARGGHQRSCLLLVEAGADTRRMNKGGDSALLLAARGGHRLVVSALAANPDAWRQRNPITGHVVAHYAAMQGCAGLVEQAVADQGEARYRVRRNTAQSRSLSGAAPAAAPDTEDAGSAPAALLHRRIGRAPPPPPQAPPAHRPSAGSAPPSRRGTAVPEEGEEQGPPEVPPLLAELAQAAAAAAQEQPAAEGCCGELFPALRLLDKPFDIPSRGALAAPEKCDAAVSSALQSLSYLALAGSELALEDGPPRPGRPVGGMHTLARALCPALLGRGRGGGRASLAGDEEADCPAHSPRGSTTVLRAVATSARRWVEKEGDDERTPALAFVTTEAAAFFDAGGARDLVAHKPMVDIVAPTDSTITAAALPPLPPFRPVHYAAALGHHQCAMHLRGSEGIPELQLFVNEAGEPAGRVPESEEAVDPEAEKRAARQRMVAGLPPAGCALYTAARTEMLPSASSGLRRVAQAEVDRANPLPPPPQKQAGVWYDTYAADVAAALSAVDPLSLSSAEGEQETLLIPRFFDVVHGRRAWWAARRGFVDLLRSGLPLLSSPDALSDQRTSLAMVAAWYDQGPAVAELLSAGADPGLGTKLHLAQSGCPGQLTPVVLAVARGSQQCAQQLLEAGADASTCDENGQTLVHHAVLRGSFETLKQLLQHDAPVARPNHFGEYPLQAAMAKRLTPMVRMIEAWLSVLSVGADEATVEEVLAASEAQERPSGPGLQSAKEMARWYQKAQSYYSKIDKMLRSGPVVNSVEADSAPCIMYCKICRNAGDAPCKAMLQQLKYYFWPDEVRELDAGGGVQLSARGLSNVLDLMMVLPNVEMLDLSGNKLDPEHVTELCRKAKLHPSLRRIRITNTRSIGRRQGMQLLQLMEKNQRIVEVDCLNTQIDAPMQARLAALGGENKRANAKDFATAANQQQVHGLSMSTSLPQAQPPAQTPQQQQEDLEQEPSEHSDGGRPRTAGGSRGRAPGKGAGSKTRKRLHSHLEHARGARHSI
eukprot:TRINITY_DN26550_c0_g1_i1.p1 TRINITY_DN26550_c0_g1~~TRINITY_DN26550_c0_g1_i1.p1  ORF type:complete len:2672 (+),score=869.85 TRINITY_DN26550_c0_g1_i1:62-8077(+)